MRHHHVEGIDDVVRQVLAIYYECQNVGRLWFRGQSRSSYELLPKIMREHKTWDEVVERESRLITRFRQRSMAYWPGGASQTVWEQLFAMQHYGIPTRLLDWSENLFVALYFALAFSISDPEDGPAVVWCMDPLGWNKLVGEPYSISTVLTTANNDAEGYEPLSTRLARAWKTPSALYGSSNSDRIIAQRGTFVIWGSETKSLEVVADAHDPVLLWRLELHGDRKKLLADLQSIGFTETMVYPELAALGVELTRTEGWS